MTIGLFADKEYQPTEMAVLEALGAKRPLWEELKQFIADNYPIPGEWNFGGKNYGWNLWYRKSGKTLVTLAAAVEWALRALQGRGHVRRPRREVESRLDREHHAGLERPGRAVAHVLADVVHVQPQPV